ncbi:PH domain-containing protein [Ophiocordyceps camponoti-floridani]|uniref:PH domain-containing protein n=1 Tax=Ophiocordyceps camponoti-floridani TaxID=2030778 RepID=A0A8H4Q3R2_9HYPO|nr:PH domain-containing protein [Ophiocordyceps camponoti-floridani]
MASYAAKVVSKKILGESLQNKFGTEDPYFETVPATRLGRPTGKYKKRKKALPPGISDHDGKILTKVKRRAYRLDLALCSFLGIRFGWGSVIGLVPAIGDALDAFMALMVFKTCCQIDGGLPSSLKVQMILNVAFDFAIGLVPFLGDLADAVFKANTRNCLLLEQHLREKGKKELRKSGLPLPAVDPSSAEEYDKTAQDISPSETPSRQPLAATPSRMEHVKSRPSAPAETQGRKGRGWFSRNKSRPHDVETGEGAGRAHISDERRGSRR